MIEFKKRFRKEAYEWIEEALEKFDYLYLSKKKRLNKEIHRESNRIFPALSYQANMGIQGKQASEGEKI